MIAAALRALAIPVVVVVAVGLSACATPGPSDRSAVSSSAAPQSSVASIAPLTGGVSGGDSLTVVGTGLDLVASVTIAGTPATFSVADAGASLTVITPAAATFAAGSAPLMVTQTDGTVLDTEDFTYALVSGVDRQLNYMLSYWQTYNTAEYQTLGGNDCVNFTSQSLLARGWTQDAEWFYKPGNVAASGLPWRSSTAMRNYLAGRPAVATALTDAQRDQVVPGDIVQFDWDNSGDRDHTGVVTRVVTDAGATKVYFAGHTNDSDFRDVDTAITVDHPGGTAFYWHLLS